MFKMVPCSMWAGFGFLAGIGSSIMFWRWKLWRTRQTDKEVFEVLWVNEHTSWCNQLESQQLNAIKRSIYEIAKNRKCNCSNKYCFNKNMGCLIQHINETKYSIDLAMYAFTSRELCAAIMGALYRGVVVRIITDRDMVQGRNSQIIELLKCGAMMRTNKNNFLMHHKFGVFDGPRRSALILSLNKTTYDDTKERSFGFTGSLNWTMQALYNNYENVVLFMYKPLIESYEVEFDRMWKAFKFNHERDWKGH